MKLTLILLLLLPSALLGAGEKPRNARSDVQWCLPDTTPQAEQLQRFLLAFSSDTTEAPVRTTLGVPTVSVDSIYPVTDESRCQRASVVIDSLLERTAGEPVHVGKYGTHFAAFEPGVMFGEFKAVFFFDSLMNFVGAVLI